MGLAHDFARVWNASAIDNIDRKRLLGLLVEDTTLTREGYRVNIGLRLRGGKTHTLQAELPRPYCMEMERIPSNEVMLELEALVNAAWDNRAAAQELNRRGHRDAQGAPFLERRIQGFRKRRNWPGCTELHRTRLREQGYVDARDLASSMGTTGRQFVNGPTASRGSKPAASLLASETSPCTGSCPPHRCHVPTRLRNRWARLPAGPAQWRNSPVPCALEPLRTDAGDHHEPGVPRRASSAARMRCSAVWPVTAPSSRPAPTAGASGTEARSVPGSTGNHHDKGERRWLLMPPKNSAATASDARPACRRSVTGGPWTAARNHNAGNPPDVVCRLPGVVRQAPEKPARHNSR